MPEQGLRGMELPLSIQQHRRIISEGQCRHAKTLGQTGRLVEDFGEPFQQLLQRWKCEPAPSDSSQHRVNEQLTIQVVVELFGRRTLEVQLHRLP